MLSTHVYIKHPWLYKTPMSMKNTHSYVNWLRYTINFTLLKVRRFLSKHNGKLA